MVTIITWNTGKKKTQFIIDSMKELAVEHSPDIFVLQECLRLYVNKILDTSYDEVAYPGVGLNRRVRMFLKKGLFKTFATVPKFNNKLLFIHLQRTGSVKQFNIAGVHLYSKLNTERQQMWKNKPIIDTIEALEKNQSNNKNTIVIGDFNYNPYDSTMLDPNVFNAIDNKTLIPAFKINPIGKNNRDYWYNPMWNFLGDFDFVTNSDKSASGTFFLYSETEIPYWNLLDGYFVTARNNG